MSTLLENIMKCCSDALTFLIFKRSHPQEFRENVNDDENERISTVFLRKFRKVHEVHVPLIINTKGDDFIPFEMSPNSFL